MKALGSDINKVFLTVREIKIRINGWKLQSDRFQVNMET